MVLTLKTHYTIMNFKANVLIDIWFILMIFTIISNETTQNIMFNTISFQYSWIVTYGEVKI